MGTASIFGRVGEHATKFVIVTAAHNFVKEGYELQAGKVYMLRAGKSYLASCELDMESV